jgi:hypothetical protein
VVIACGDGSHAAQTDRDIVSTAIIIALDSHRAIALKRQGAVTIRGDGDHIAHVGWHIQLPWGVAPGHYRAVALERQAEAVSSGYRDRVVQASRHIH